MRGVLRIFVHEATHEGALRRHVFDDIRYGSLPFIDVFGLHVEFDIEHEILGAHVLPSSNGDAVVAPLTVRDLASRHVHAGQRAEEFVSPENIQAR